LQAGWVWGTAAVLTALLASTWAWRRLRAQPWPDLARWPRRVVLFQIAFLTAVPLFLLKDSYDYRLVLWLPCLSLPFAWLRPGAVDVRWRRFAIVLIALFLFVAGIELPCTWLDALADHSGMNWPNKVATVLAYAKQFAAWTLAGLLTLLFAQLVLRPRAGVERAPALRPFER
jgi:hypothetical protein